MFQERIENFLFITTELSHYINIINVFDEIEIMTIYSVYLYQSKMTQKGYFTFV